jgi:hypothetical protein
VTLDWSTCSEVEHDPAKLSGAWVFRGTRVPVSALFENLEGGATVDQFRVPPGARWKRCSSTRRAARKQPSRKVRILFDQGVPAPLREHLRGHQIKTAFELGWSALRNGELPARAEPQFDALITTDRNLQTQQNLSLLKIAILVLPTTSWPRLQGRLHEIAVAVDSLKPAQYLELPL